MTKPTITTRAVKAAALTYNELDQNFTNLRDATIGITDGTTSGSLNLNDTLTFTAGTGVTLSYNATTKALTVSSSATSNAISQGDSSITVTDSGVGSIDFTVDATNVMKVTVGGLKSYREVVYAGGNTSTSVTPDRANGSIQTFTATASFTLNAPTNMSAGQSLVLIITQDGTGSRVMTANSSYKFVNNYKTLSTTPTFIDVISIFYDGSRYLCNLNKGYV